MSIPLKIRTGTTRNFPQQGDYDLFNISTLWAKEVTDAINDSPMYIEVPIYDAIVGSAADITAGLATYSTVAAAITAAPAGGRIFILDGTYTPAAQIDVTKALIIEGQGETTVIASDSIAAGATIKISASGVELKNFKVTQGAGTPDYALEIAAALERISFNIRADGTFAVGSILDNTVIGAKVGAIEIDTNSLSMLGESAYTKYLRLEDVTTAAWDLIVRSNSTGDVLTTNRTLTLNVHDGDRTLAFYENLTIGDGFDVTITAQDQAGAIVLDNCGIEVEDAVGAGSTIKLVAATDSGVKTITLSEDLTIGNGFNISLTAEDAVASFIFDNANVEFESTDAAQRLFKFTSAKAGDTLLTLEENLTIGDGFDVTITAQDIAGAIVLDNCGLEVEDTVGAGSTIKLIAATDSGVKTITLSENLTIGDGYNISITAEDAAAAVVLDHADLEIENTNANHRSFKITSAKAGNTTLTLEENFTIGDGYDITITAEDAASSITLDNATFEIENTDGTQRLIKITSAKAGATTLTFQENFTIQDGFDVGITAEDAATAITFDNADLEIENTDGTHRLIKITSAKAGNTTLTFQEDLTISDGFDITMVAEDAATSLTFDNVNFEVECGFATQRLLKLVIGTDAAATLQVEGTAGAIDQDLTVDASPTFAGSTLTGALLMDHIATPANPAANHLKFYPKADNRFYQLDSTGRESVVGGMGVSQPVQWRLDYAIAPLEENSGGVPVLDFNQADSQGCYCLLTVPNDYVAGTQILFKNGSFATTATADKIKFKTTTYLIEDATTVLGTYPNSHASTNAEVTADGDASTITPIGDVDLTDATGNINGQAVAAGDKLLILLIRDCAGESASAAADARLLRDSFTPYFG
jgi:carbonic anhydrase/acetyltransferase-like protein (isoleucine patch superfamily)